MKKYSIIIGILIAAFCLLSISATPGYAYIVYPDDEYWGPDARTTENDGTEDDSNAGTVEISAAEPRSGNASLKLTVGGDNNPMDDWAFYTRTADENGWGLLSEVTALSFDWFRATDTDEEYLDYDPWNLQTPVLRLLIYDGGTYSELVWEQYYTDINYYDADYEMQVGEWVTEDLMEQYFWQYISSSDTEDTGYVTSDGLVLEDFGNDTLMAMNLYDWLLSGFFSTDAIVYGISVGVGSAWPGDYLGYLDNIYLAFGDKIVLDDNFELPIPEPSTILLLMAAMGATLVAGRRRRLKE